MRSKFTTLTLVILISQLFLPAANAHTALISTVPAQNSELVTSPSEVVLTFNENLLQIANEESNFIKVYNGNNNVISIGEAQITGSIITQKLDPGADLSGRYRVTYRTVSADGHPVTGEYFFTVLDSQEPAPIQTPSPKPITSEGFFEENALAIGIALIVFSLIMGKFIYRRMRR